MFSEIPKTKRVTTTPINEMRHMKISLKNVILLTVFFLRNLLTKKNPRITEDAIKMEEKKTTAILLSNLPAYSYILYSFSYVLEIMQKSNAVPIVRA